MSGAEATPVENANSERELALLLTEVYGDLRARAAKYLEGERRDHTLQPTAMVHEAFLELADESKIWCNREHFIALCARILRRILVDHARKRGAKKRGAGACRIELEEGLALTPDAELELLDLDEALCAIQRENPRRARVIEMHLFSGLSLSEIAKVLDVSERTAKKDWRLGRIEICEKILA